VPFVPSGREKERTLLLTSQVSSKPGEGGRAAQKKGSFAPEEEKKTGEATFAGEMACDRGGGGEGFSIVSGKSCQKRGTASTREKGRQEFSPGGGRKGAGFLLLLKRR